MIAYDAVEPGGKVKVHAFAPDGNRAVCGVRRRLGWYRVGSWWSFIEENPGRACRSCVERIVR